MTHAHTLKKKKKFICWMRICFWLSFSCFPPGLVCMKSSSSVVELVMLLCSQASLASLSFLIPVLCFSTSLIYQAHLECSKFTALSLLRATLSTFPRSPFPYWGQRNAEERPLRLQILVWGSRVADLSASPLTWAPALVAWAKLMRRDNVDLMVLCIDYPSLLCCLVGVLLPSLFSCCRIHEY